MFPPCRPNYGRGFGSNGDLLQKYLCQHSAAPRTVVVSAPDPVAGCCQPTLLPETLGHSQARLRQPFVLSLLLSPGSCAHKFLLCPPRVCFPGGSQSFCWISRLGNLLWALKLLQQGGELLWCKFSPVCGLSACWLYSGTNGNLLQEDLCHMLYLSGLLQTEPLSPHPLTADPYLLRKDSNTQRHV